MSRRIISGIMLILVALGIGFSSKVETSTIFQLSSTQTVVKLNPHFLKVYTSQIFTITVLIENVSSLYAFDIQITWNTTHLKYLTHTATVPVETYPDGILHEPLFGWGKDDVDENASMPGAAPETRYWIAAASQHPAPVFNGSGNAFNMTFKALNQTGMTTLNFTYTALSDKQAVPIPYSSFHCVVETVNAHDIAVTNVASSKTEVEKGSSVTLNITLENQGSYTETFNLTTYANTTTIQTERVTLENGSSTIIPFTWNTTDFAEGNYTISAYAVPVPGEVDTLDNSLTDGWILVVRPGDINGDTAVNYLDAILLGAAFNCGIGHERWNSNADVNGDDYINYLDAIILGAHFGETDP